jgi:hypothetical protein
VLCFALDSRGSRSSLVARRDAAQLGRLWQRLCIFLLGDGVDRAGAQKGAILF